MNWLSLAELATMHGEHHDDGTGHCYSCRGTAGVRLLFPCSIARLLDQFAPGPVPHLAGLAYGLCGPVSSDELPQ